MSRRLFVSPALVYGGGALLMAAAVLLLSPRAITDPAAWLEAWLASQAWVVALAWLMWHSNDRKEE